MWRFCLFNNTSELPKVAVSALNPGRLSAELRRASRPGAMLSLLVGTAAVPLAPREKGNLPGPMIYSARDAPGPMIIDTKFTSVVPQPEYPPPLATLDDDFVAKAQEAARAAEATIKEQTEAILAQGGGRNHVMNLGHGIDATTPEHKAKLFVDTVQAWRQ